MNHGKDEAVVCAGCLLFVPAACTQQDKDDAVNSALYMQLAASKKHSRFTEFGQWDDTFLRAMVAFGWELKSNLSVSQNAPVGGPLTLWDCIKADLPSFVPVDALWSAQAQVRRCLTTAPDQPAIRLYADQVQQHTAFLQRVSGSQDQDGGGDTAAETKISLQLGFLSPDSSLCIVGLNFISRLPLKPEFMFQPIAAQDVTGNIELTCCALRSQEQALSRHRHLITAALASRRQALISPLRETADVQ